MGYNHAKNSAYLWCSCYCCRVTVASFKPTTFWQATLGFQCKDRQYATLYSLWNMYFVKYYFVDITKAIQIINLIVESRIASVASHGDNSAVWTEITALNDILLLKRGYTCFEVIANLSNLLHRSQWR